MRGFGDATASRGNRERMSDLVPIHPWPEGDYDALRMVGPVFSVEQIWFKIPTRAKPNGQSIPKQCLDHDGETDKHVTDICPYFKSGLGRPGKKYYVNVIVRSLQQDSRGRPLDFPVSRTAIETRLGYKAYWGKKGDERKTPVRVLEVPDGQVEKLKSLRKLNRGKTADGVATVFELSDPKMGCDINIMFDSTKKGAACYDIQKGDRTPLTREERSYIIFPLDLLKPDRLEEAKREMKDLEAKVITEDARSGSRDDDRGSRGKDARHDDRRSSRRGQDSDDPLLEDDTTDIDYGDLDGDLGGEDRAPSRGRDRTPARAPTRGGRGAARDDLDDDSYLDEDLDASLDEDLDTGLDDLDEDRAPARGRERSRERERDRAPARTPVRSSREDRGRDDRRSNRR